LNYAVDHLDEIKIHRERKKTWETLPPELPE